MPRTELGISIEDSFFDPEGEWTDAPYAPLNVHQEGGGIVEFRFIEKNLYICSQR